MAKPHDYHSHTYLEMNCIGDYADFVVYQNHNAKCGVLETLNYEQYWMVPGTWNDRDEFGRLVD